MKKRVMIFFFFSIILLVYHALALELLTDQMNFPPGAVRNHTQRVNYTGDTLNVTIPSGFSVVFNSSGSAQVGSNITWGSGTNREVNYTLQSPSSCSEGTTYRSDVYVNGVLQDFFTFVCIADNKIVDYKLEYGHGDANYLSEDFISNESVTLFNLIRVFSIGHYLDPDAEARNAIINCTFENFPVRTFGRIDLHHGDTSMFGNFFWDVIESGYWFRIGVVSQDVSGKSVGQFYNVSCSALTYNVTHHQVRAYFANKTIEVRSITPFNINVTEQSDRLLYVINNTEKYSLEEAQFRWSVAGSHKSESFKTIQANDSFQFDVFLDGNSTVTLTIDFVPSWFANSRNPTVYTQTHTQTYNINTNAAAITDISHVLLKAVNSTISSIQASQAANFRVELSDFDELNANQLYRARLLIINHEGKPINADALPNITIYNPTRAIFASANMTLEETGIYNYSTNISSGNVTGVWEAIVSVIVNGTTVKPNDFFELEGSPAEVKINSITDNTIPTITADVTITNEGEADQEYQYEYCIVVDQANQCGGDDDLAYASAAKFIAAGDSFNTQLTLGGITQTGNLYFKVVVYFGTERSGASLLFNAIEEAAPAPAPAPVAVGRGPAVPRKEVVKKIPPEEVPLPEIEIVKREGRIELTGYPIAITIIKAEKTSQKLQVRNVGDGDLTNIYVVISGVPLKQFVIVPEEYDLLSPGEARNFTLELRGDIAVGTYDIELAVISDQGATKIDGVLIVKGPSYPTERLPLVGAAIGLLTNYGKLLALFVVILVLLFLLYLLWKYLYERKRIPKLVFIRGRG